MDDIVTRLADHDHSLSLMTEAADEIEALRDLCARMAALLDDCRPHDATLMWVIRRLDAIEEWQQRSTA